MKKLMRNVLSINPLFAVALSTLFLGSSAVSCTSSSMSTQGDNSATYEPAAVPEDAAQKADDQEAIQIGEQMLLAFQEKDFAAFCEYLSPEYKQQVNQSDFMELRTNLGSFQQ